MSLACKMSQELVLGVDSSVKSLKKHKAVVPYLNLGAFFSCEGILASSSALYVKLQVEKKHNLKLYN